MPDKETKRDPGKLGVFLLIILIIVVCAALIEGGFRLYLRVTGTPDIEIIKFDQFLEEAWFQPHPYLVYVFKPNHKFRMSWLGLNDAVYTTNSFGFRTTLEYEVSLTKPPNVLRIATLGGSTTMGINSDNEVWPYLLGKDLSAEFPDKKIEILNEGLMGYTTHENLIDLEMRAIDFKNDVYVLYTGINDRLTAAPVSFYRTDNSHFRKDLYQNVLFSFVELSPRWLLKSKVMKRLFLILGSTDRRNLLDNTTVGEMWRKFPDETEKPAIMNRVNAVAMRNIESMVGVIRAHNPNALILLGSLFHINDPKEIKDLNSALQRYAEEAGLVFVDVAGELPHEEGIVYYDCHFTIEGEKRVATLFANAITDALKKSAPLPPSP